MIFSAFAVANAGELRAQWVQMDGTDSVDVFAFASIGGYLFAATENGVYRSHDSGTTWTFTNDGIADPNVYCFASSDTILYAGANENVYKTTNYGANWTVASQGLLRTDVYAITVSGPNVLACPGEVLYKSTDNAASWVPVNGVDTNLSLILTFIHCGYYLFAGSESKGVFRSTDNGDSWTQSSFGLTNLNVWALAVSGENVYAGTLGGGVFRSTDSGKSWALASYGLTDSKVDGLAVNGNNLFAATQSEGIFFSSNNGDSWTKENAGLTDLDIWTLISVEQISSQVLMTQVFGVAPFPISESFRRATSDSGKFRDSSLSQSVLGFHNDLLHFGIERLCRSFHCECTRCASCTSLFRRACRRRVRRGGLHLERSQHLQWDV